MPKSLIKRIEEIEFAKHQLPDYIEYQAIAWHDIQIMLKELDQYTKEYSKPEMNESIMYTIYQSISELFFILGEESRNLPETDLKSIQMDDLIVHSFLDGLQQIVHEFITPEIDNLIECINCALEVSLNKEEVLNTYDEYWNVAYLMKDYYSNATYQNMDPLYLLEQFISEYSIYLTCQTNDIWKIVFTDAYCTKRKEYTDNDFYQIMAVICEQTMDEVCSLLKDKKWYTKKFYVKPYPIENVNFQIIQTMTPQELFDYLKLRKGVVLNMEDFKFLYLLLNYRNLYFDEERLKRWVKYNIEHSEYAKRFDAEKNVFCGYEFPLSNIE